MPRPPSPLPRSLTRRPFTTAEALALALPAARLRTADLSRPFHGVRAHRAAVTLEELAQAYAARMPEHEMFTHTTAASIHGMRMPDHFAETLLHVAAAAPHPPPRSRGVVGHRYERQLGATMIGGLRTARPVDAWVQCASILALDDLIVMGDGLIRRHGAVTTMAELELHVGSLHGLRGIITMRLALAEMRSRTDSPKETTLRLLVTRAGFPEPEVNGEIRNEYGAVIAHGDLVFRAQKLVLEYDGGVHRQPRQHFLDIYRLDEIMEEGWRVIRVDKYMVANPFTLFAKLRRALATR